MRILPDYPAALRSAPPGFQAMLWVSCTLALAAAPQVLHLPLWITLFSLALGAGRVYIARRRWRLPNRWLCMLLALGALGGVFYQFGTLLGRDAGAAMLTIMLAFKLLETKAQRDCMLLIFMGYFLCIINFLYTQSIPVALYISAVVWGLTSALILINQPADQAQTGPTLRLSGSLLAQSLPFMLVLFVLFPRVNGSLWGLPHDAFGSSTGLSDSMTAGSIGGLAQSHAVAFRAAFSGPLPDKAQRYWRGPVFWQSDGRSWSAGQPDGLTEPLHLQVSGAPLDYTLTVEPHQKNWLFALDLPVTAPGIGHLTSDFELVADSRVTERVRYATRSYPHYDTGPLSSADRARALQLPDDANPQARSLAAHWRAVMGSDEQVIAAALEYFRAQPFYYTLNPPQIDTGPRASPVDEFLFGTRRGFCEHYSAAFTTLLRAAHIPARVVTGYQGGEFNPLGNYLIVRQSDAHAWSEAWLKGRGWVRFDPTAAIAPGRVERDVPQDDFSEEAGYLSDGQRGYLSQSLQQLRFVWDSANFQWGQWVLSYGPARQSQLLANLGLDKLAYGSLALGLGVALGIALLLCSLAAGLLFLRRVPKDAALVAYQHFCAKLARKGVTRSASEGPYDYAARAALKLPQHARQIQLISQLYTKLRYTRKPAPQTLARLRSTVRAFRA